jgi:L-amino acid N-acyltransferase YncA
LPKYFDWLFMLPDSDTLRDATFDDLPQIVAIYNASIPGRLATADTEPITVESRHEWFAGHSPDSRPLWVVERNHQLIAWISLRSFYGRPAYHATAEVSLYIAPEHQGRGLGTQLLQILIERCPSLGVRTLVGFVFAHNAPSLRMNEKVGFERWGLLPAVAELDGEWRDLMIIGRKIAA